MSGLLPDLSGLLSKPSFSTKFFTFGLSLQYSSIFVIMWSFCIASRGGELLIRKVLSWFIILCDLEQSYSWPILRINSSKLRSHLSKILSSSPLKILTLSNPHQRCCPKNFLEKRFLVFTKVKFSFSEKSSSFESYTLKMFSNPSYQWFQVYQSS
jgi:hypothetical protein